MGHYRRIPFLLSALMAFIIGVASYITDTDGKTIYIKMTIAMVVSYIVGIFLKNTLSTISNELVEKREKAENEDDQETDNESANMANYNGNTNVSRNDSRINLTAGGSDDEFTPLLLNKVISSKLKE